MFISKVSREFIIDERTSKQIWTLKAFAVFSIFFAHMPLADSQTTPFSLIYEVLGWIGVPMFLVLSGLLYKPLNIQGWKRRFKRLLLPLFLWGTVTYLIHCLPSSTTFSMTGYGLWIIGSNTFLYFVWMLLSIMLLYQVFDSPFVWIFIGIGSIVLSQLDLIPYTSNWTPYLNPFNFIFYFSFGTLLRRRNLWEYRESLALVIGAIFIFLTSYLLCLINSWNLFFNVHTMLMQISITWILISLVAQFRILPKFLIYVGKVSFLIYLMHIQFASTINILALPLPYMQVIKVVVAFSAVLLLIYVMDFLTKKIPAMHRYRSVLGFID